MRVRSLAIAFTFILSVAQSTQCQLQAAPNMTHTKTSDTKGGCGYPVSVRDGLHPFQYYCLAKVYLCNANLELARICLKKLRNSSSKELGNNLANNLEKALMPMFPVADEALAKFKEAISKRDAERYRICRELTQKFPNFEWPYLVLADEGYSLEPEALESRKKIIQKVLSINPTNVIAISHLADVLKYENKSEEGFSCLQNAEKYYPEIVRDSNYSILKPRKETEHKVITNKELAAKVIHIPAQEKVQERSYSFIDKQGKAVFCVGPNAHVSDQFSDELLLVNGSENRGSFRSPDVQYWKKDGSLAFGTGYSDAKSAHEGLCAVQKSQPDGASRWGFYDKSGKSVIPGKFSDTLSFKDDRAAVEIYQRLFFSPFSSGWGYIDRNGAWQAEPIYDDIYSYSEGLAPVSINGKIGFINKLGRFAIEPKYDLARPFSEGLANVVTFDEKKRSWDDQYIDKNGKVIFHNVTILPGDRPLRQMSSDGVLSAHNTYSRIRVSNETTKYSEWDFHDKRLVASENNKYGFKDYGGKFVIEPKFDRAYAFSEGLARVKMGDKYGFVNSSGDLVIPCTFEKASDFSEGLASVSTDGKRFGYINEKGERVIPETYLEAKSFSNGLAKVGSAMCVAISKKSGNIEGEQLIPSDTSALGVELSRAISKQWHCSGQGKIFVVLKFEMTDDGNIYHLNLIKGFEDPLSIKASLRAVLHAMPFKVKTDSKSQVTCTITGDKKFPEVRINATKVESRNVKDELKKISPVSNMMTQTFLHGAMSVRLYELCKLLYDFPDSTEIKSEIQKIVSYLGLDVSKSHDWVCIGRWRARNITIQRNPSNDSENDVKVSLAAYLEAWKLSQDQKLLFEMEQAYLRQMALNVLAASNADPLLLGNAAILTNQYEEAEKYFNVASLEGNAKGTEFLKQLKSNVTSEEILAPELSDKFVPKRDATAWKAVIRWLPVDVETVMFTTKSSKEKSIVGGLSFFGDLIIDPSREEIASTKPNSQQIEINKLFVSVPEIYCLHAARAFKDTRGEGPSNDINIFVLPENSKQIAKQVIEKSEPYSVEKQMIEGVQVFSFKKTPWTFGSFVGGTFLCSPYEGTLIVANDLNYLHEVLLRLRNKPDDRALPETNPEWKLVDTKSQFWAVRHYDQSYVPFDNIGMYDIVTAKYISGGKSDDVPDPFGEEIGFTLHLNGSKLIVNHLSKNQSTLQNLERSWIYLYNYNGMSAPTKQSIKPGNPITSIKNNVLCVDGEIPKQSLIMIQVLLSLGYFVAI